MRWWSWLLVGLGAVFVVAMAGICASVETALMEDRARARQKQEILERLAEKLLAQEEGSAT